MEAQWERIETQRKQIEEEAKAERDGLLEEMEAQRKVMDGGKARTSVCYLRGAARVTTVAY